MSTGKRLVIIGGGIAGVSAAQSARHEYPGAQIELLSSEIHSFYNRIALNAFITGKRRMRHLQFYEPNWLAQEQIAARWGVAVECIDLNRHELQLNDGQSIEYDKLILATGARPKLPPIAGTESENVFCLWSLDDAVQIKNRLRFARSVFVLGAGVLGVETAFDLVNAGQKVTLGETEDRIMPLQLDAIAAERYGAFLSAKGVKLALGLDVVRIESDLRGAAIEARDGRQFRADAVLVMAGVAPDTRLARSASISCESGIVVNRYLQTSAADVLACGNCAEVNGETQLLWNSALRQGQTAGVNAFSAKQTVAHWPVVIHVKIPELPLFVAGSFTTTTPDDVRIWDESDASFREIVLDRDRRVKSAVFLGQTSGAWSIERAQRTGQSISGIVHDVEGVLDELSAATSSDQAMVDESWVCQMCGYNHESGDPPEICPVCGVGKDQFLAA